MRPHLIDTAKPSSATRLAAFLRLERQSSSNPSRTTQFRKAGQTIRSMRLRQYLRIARQSEI